MATYVIYSTTPQDCLAFTVVALKFGRTSSDMIGITAVIYDGDPSDIVNAIDEETGVAHYLFAEVVGSIAWKGTSELSSVGELMNMEFMRELEAPDQTDLTP